MGVAWKLLKSLRVLLYCIELHSIVCIALHCLYCIVLHCIALHCIVLKFHCSRLSKSCLNVHVWWWVVGVLNFFKFRLFQVSTFSSFHFFKFHLFQVSPFSSFTFFKFHLFQVSSFYFFKFHLF